MDKHFIAPSVLSADYGYLAEGIQMINESQADWPHIDIMDGLFVPNISFGMDVCKRIGELSTKPLDVHLMIQEPDRYIEQFVAIGAHFLSVHIEACTHLHRTIQNIRSLDAKPGVALNPHTPVSHLESIIADLDIVIIMSVNPGFGGQKLIPHTYHKIKQLRQLIKTSGSKAIIEIDGGVNGANAPLLLEAGADSLVAGSYVFKADDPKQTIAELKALHV